MKIKGFDLTIEDAKALPEVFYMKHWQNNGYYYVDKIVRDGNLFLRYNFKGNGWNIHCHYTMGEFVYLCNHNGLLLSDKEMTDEDNYNFD